MTLVANLVYMSRTLLRLLLLLALLQNLPAVAQTYPDSLQPKRLRTLAVAGGGAYASLMIGLNELWYKGHERSAFHFFNDNQQWLKVDKVGHGYSAYHLSRIHYEAFRWTGLSPKKAALWSSLGGLAWMLPIEILDGFSAAYGASSGDLVANAGGVLLFGSQQLLWGEQRIYPRFSFHPTDWAPLRPALLGKTAPEQLMKDYNGQTYWLSADLFKFSQGRTPSWLNLAIGYGASGMVYAEPAENQQQGYQAYAQWFLAPDLNLSRIRTNKKAIRWLLFVLDGIHLPAPALEFSQKRLHFHPLYF